MRRSFITLYALAATALTAVAQPRFTSNTETYDFGQIEWKHPVTVQYSITNTGDRPLVLTEVEPDCACSVAQWTKTPIAPGATKTHPYLIGQIRIDKNSLDFPDVQAGEKPVMHIGVVNLSDRPYEPVLMHLPPYLQTEVKPNVLQKGEKGVITVTLDSERLTDFGLTQSSVYLARFAGDKVGDENEIPVSAILLPDFSGMSDTEKANAPVVNLSIKDIDMSTALAKKSKARQDIVITNTGRSPLQISKLQVFHPAVGAGLKKSVLKPGESTRLRVTVVKRNIGKKRRHLRLLMITNDPMQPKVEINIKAK